MQSPRQNFWWQRGWFAYGFSRCGFHRCVIVSDASRERTIGNYNALIEGPLRVSCFIYLQHLQVLFRSKKQEEEEESTSPTINEKSIFFSIVKTNIVPLRIHRAVDSVFDSSSMIHQPWTIVFFSTGSPKNRVQGTRGWWWFEGADHSFPI